MGIADAIFATVRVILFLVDLVIQIVAFITGLRWLSSKRYRDEVDKAPLGRKLFVAWEFGK